MALEPVLPLNRRQLLARGAFAAATLALPAGAQSLPVLDVAAAGSLRSLLEGPLKVSAARSLQLDLHTHAQGADAVARSIVTGSLHADVFLPVTASPMRTVLRAGKAHTAYPVAKTEMVLFYSPNSRFAAQLASAATGVKPWWQMLQEPGLRFARSNPLEDPSGRSILFTLMLAAKQYQQPDLAQRILGGPLNPAQVQEGTAIHAGLANGTIDAIGGYRSSVSTSNLPFVSLPPEINLSDTQVRARHPDIVLAINGQTFYPEPLLFYAATLDGASSPAGATRFLDWLRGAEAAALFRASGFALPSDPAPLTA